MGEGVFGKWKLSWTPAFSEGTGMPRQGPGQRRPKEPYTFTTGWFLCSVQTGGKGWDIILNGLATVEGVPSTVKVSRPDRGFFLFSLFFPFCPSVSVILSLFLPLFYFSLPFIYFFFCFFFFLLFLTLSLFLFFCFPISTAMQIILCFALNSFHVLAAILFLNVLCCNTCFEVGEEWVIYMSMKIYKNEDEGKLATVVE